MCTLNAPGTFHDLTIVDNGVYDAMEWIFEIHEAKEVVDSAFNVGTREICQMLNQAAIAVQQLSEWGM